MPSTYGAGFPYIVSFAFYESSSSYYLHAVYLSVVLETRIHFSTSPSCFYLFHFFIFGRGRGERGQMPMVLFNLD